MTQLVHADNNPLVYTVENSASAASSDASAALSAVPDRSIQLLRVIWSYSGAPTNGRVDIITGVTTRSFDVITGGPGFLDLTGIATAKNEAVTATIKNGGSGITGRVTLTGKY